MGIPKRVEDMLPRASAGEAAAAAAELRSWIVDHSAAVRTMGQTNRTMAHVSTYRPGDVGAVDCSFIDRTGSAYVVSITAGSRHDLSEGMGHTVDLVAAMSAIGALLAELGMLARLA